MRSLFCQILLPGLFALFGLAILESVFATNYPKIEMSMEQWYEPDEYTVQFANDSTVNATYLNAPFLLNDSLFDVWNDAMASDFGAMAAFQYKNRLHEVEGEEVTDSVRSLNNTKVALFQQRSEGESRQYNAFWAPATLCTDSNTGSYCDGQHLSESPLFSIVNVSAVHALPISFNMVNNWILRQSASNTAGTTPWIRFYAWPFAETETEKAFSGQIAGLLISFFMMIALTFIPIGAAYNIVNDRVNLTKHQQLVSGVSCGMLCVCGD